MAFSILRDLQACTQAPSDPQGTSHSLLRTPLFGSAVPRRQRTGALRYVTRDRHVLVCLRHCASDVPEVLLSNIKQAQIVRLQPVLAATLKRPSTSWHDAARRLRQPQNTVRMKPL